MAGLYSAAELKEQWESLNGRYSRIAWLGGMRVAGKAIEDEVRAPCNQEGTTWGRLWENSRLIKNIIDAEKITKKKRLIKLFFEFDGDLQDMEGRIEPLDYPKILKLLSLEIADRSGKPTKSETENAARQSSNYDDDGYDYCVQRRADDVGRLKKIEQMMLVEQKYSDIQDAVEPNMVGKKTRDQHKM